MKQVFKFFYFLLLTISLNSCSKDNVNSDTKAPGQISYLLTIDADADTSFDKNFTAENAIITAKTYPEGKTIKYQSGVHLRTSTTTLNDSIFSSGNANILAYDKLNKLSVSFTLTNIKPENPISVPFFIFVFYENDMVYKKKYTTGAITNKFVHEFTWSIDKGVEKEENRLIN